MKDEMVLRTGNTKDLNLVAALVAMGFDADTGAVDNGDRVVRTYVFQPLNRDGTHTVREMMAAWKEGEPWVKKNQTHPFSYLMMAMKIRKELVDGIKNDKPLVRVSSGDSLALIHPDCSEETEKRILGGLA